MSAFTEDPNPLQSADASAGSSGSDTDVGAAPRDVEKASEPEAEDAVFGKLEGGQALDYRAVGAKGAFVLLVKVNLGLGVLGLPHAFGVLGLIPGIISIVVIQTIFCYCALMIGRFKVAHPQVYTVSDAAAVFGGRWAREFWFFALNLQMIFFVAAACVGVSTALNAVSAHGACTAIFIAVAGVLAFLFGSIPTLGAITWIGWVGLASILAAVFTVTVAVGVQSRPSLAPSTGPFDKDVKLFGDTTFPQAMAAINQILFAYGSTPMFFGIASEMREPRKFTRAMVASIGFLTTVYLVVGVVVYEYCGQYVASPSLGSAGPLLKKICYGIAIPGLLASMTLFTHMAAKNIFVRALTGSRHLAANTPTHWAAWLGITLACAVIGYIIASAIPIFDSLISIIGALVVPTLSVIPYTFMWWHDNYRFVPPPQRTLRKRLHLYLNIVILAVALFLTAAGTYGAVDDLRRTTNNSKPWTCHDNSGTVKN
ncbi:hypothetical protein Q8F55_008761 [Vanrija albida]|uniref:Amino acid transporter transmembrane domain-containing protein n=1 Tax=Vanrija albida TaxID=181172 RepID=A0ABR3PSQ3_9TREE